VVAAPFEWPNRVEWLPKQAGNQSGAVPHVLPDERIEIGGRHVHRRSQFQKAPLHPQIMLLDAVDGREKAHQLSCSDHMDVKDRYVV